MHCPVPAPALFLPFLTQLRGLMWLTGLGSLSTQATIPRLWVTALFSRGAVG